MRTLLVFSQKGGSGKTTVAVHLAVAASESGEQVVLIDTDPQRSALKWGQARSADSPTVVAVSVANCENTINAAQQSNKTLCIVDSAPHASPDASRLLQYADAVLIPCRPTAFDLGAFARTSAMVEAAGSTAVAVLNACPARAPEVEEARRVIDGFGIGAIETTLGERRAFARAVATGRSVTEFDPQGKAATEIRALWETIKGALQ